MKEPVTIIGTAIAWVIMIGIFVFAVLVLGYLIMGVVTVWGKIL